ncbi:MAG TPA: MBL fold metallo-hydrolase [Candidatus Binatia bacterium]|jgi:L-ascorbate metabolism protein UlaG (beta-lactamase superfamily)|nr:MBL fold metallo-hydrolase [Candidatus Binatia bacterium]
MKRRGFIGLLAAGLVVLMRDVAQAVCNPSLVRLLGQVRQLVQVRSGKSPSLGHYFLQWYGHSSFLIHSGSQTKVVADPNFNVTPGIHADAVTVSNDHFTHNNTGAVTGNPVILRGITFRQTWNPIRTSVKDITIVNIPSQRGQSWGGIANSIFIYEMGSLCLAHLGNIGHLLTPEQEKVMQRVDVMMVPIDAMTNLGFEDIVKVIDQVKPPIVIPMHYDVARQGELFAASVGEHYPVRRISSSQLVLSRAMLPSSTEIFVLTHPHVVGFGD